MENRLKAIVLFFLKLIHIKLDEKTIDGLIQFIKFGIVGVSNTLVSYVINIIVLVLLKPMNVSWDYVAGNMVAFLLSVLWSFYWNNRFVFTEQGDKKRSWVKTLLKTYVAYSFTGIVLNNILSWLWIDMLGVSKFIAPLINLIISVPLNFVINKFWAFKTK